jgi:hypothetical protein
VCTEVSAVPGNVKLSIRAFDAPDFQHILVWQQQQQQQQQQVAEAPRNTPRRLLLL